VRNPLDTFILARLEREGLEPSPEADRSTLLRRVCLDLTGLPPAPEAVAAFQADRRPDAYERAVDRLLDSPHYGERWGRHWLDVARYADSNGYSIDAPRSLWPWRDWVIGALNEDQPYDAFVIDQLAGDLLAASEPGASEAVNHRRRLATGFHRNTQINEEGGIDPEQFRIEAVIDRVNTTAAALLGLTVSCAQCHDHKFDPVSQEEYFRLFAFFNTQDEPVLETGSPELRAARDQIREVVRSLEDQVRARSAELEPGLAAWESSLSPASRDTLPPEVRKALALRPENRNEAQRKRVLESYLNTDPDYRTLQERLAQTRASEPRIPTTLVLSERTEPRPSYVFIKGDFTRRGPEVQPGTPRILPPLVPRHASAPDRLDLARWLFQPGQPLTARVMVNRMWQLYFGKGLVETENDFGTQGIPPVHPDLLDWLACEFQDPASAPGEPLGIPTARRWSLKHLHRLIVTSATYRQASRSRTDLTEQDPLNRLLGRQNRLRLEAEIVRDVALTASGTLDRTMGGHGVFPPQPDGVMSLGQSRREWKVSPGGGRYRRGLYTFYWRATPHPALAVFDAPDAFSTCTRRIRSNTPLQALTLLNDQAFVELATALSERLIRDVPAPQRIDRAFELCLSRPPRPAERQRVADLFHEEFRAQGEAAAWLAVARVLLNLDETITRE
jgi:hypothetical protein